MSVQEILFKLLLTSMFGWTFCYLTIRLTYEHGKKPSAQNPFTRGAVVGCVLLMPTFLICLIGLVWSLKW